MADSGEVSSNSANLALEEVLRSKTFARANRLRGLLEFVGRETLAGRGAEMKESVLAVEVFGRDGSFDNQTDAVVRVTFRNLRERLDRYYQTEGAGAAVRVEIPRNSYAPIFSSVAKALAAPVRSRWLLAAAGLAAALVLATLVAGARPGRPVRSVVVRPFTSTDGGAYLAEAFSEELARLLQHIQGLRVTGPATSRKLSDLSAAERLWGAPMAVEGQVFSDGARIRVEARLVRTGDRGVVWRTEVERADGNLLHGRDEVARDLAAALGYPSPATRAVVRAGPASRDAAARDLYWQGRYRRGQWPDGLPASVPFFERALQRDPQFAEAEAALGYALSHLAFHGFGPPRPLAQRAVAAADRALAANRSLVEAHLARALMQYAHLGRWNDAEISFRQAMLADPHHAKTCNMFAIALATRGRFDEALSMMDRAERLDPLAYVASNDRPLLLYMAGRHEQAAERARAALAARPEFYPARVLIGCARLQQGRFEEGVEELRVAYQASNRNVPVAARYGAALAMAGRAPEAAEVMRQAEAALAGESGCVIELACLATALQQRSRGLDCLERMAAQGTSGVQFMAVEPLLGPLASEPRFQNLKKTLGL